MRKIYSVLLAAVSLLFSANLSAVDVATIGDLQKAIDDTPAGGIVDIRLTANIEVGSTPIRIYANYDEAGRTVNLDLNGKTISASGDNKYSNTAIMLFKGNLNITGSGTIKRTLSARQSYAAILVFGAPKDVANWSNLTIGKDVTITTEKGIGVSIEGFAKTYSVAYVTTSSASHLNNRSKVAGYLPSGLVSEANAIKEETNVYFKPVTSGIFSLNGQPIVDYLTSVTPYKSEADAYGYYAAGSATEYAYGANVEVEGKVFGEKYGIKINGTIKTDGTYRPYLHVASTAEVWASPSVSGSTGVYSSGQGDMLIEGYVHGATGVTVKSGSVELKDAVIASDYKGEYVEPEARTKANGTTIQSGFEGAGSAIIIGSQNGWAGEQEVIISGDTKVQGGSGYAIDEAVINGETRVSAVTVEGGTIEAGGQGAIILTKETAEGDNVVSIVGANIENNIAIKDGENITDAEVENFIPKNDGNYYTTTTITKEDGKEVVVVTKFEDEADKPVDANSVVAAADNTGINWTVTADTEETLTDDKTLTYLEAASDNKQVLNVGDADHNVTLTIGRVVLGVNAQINVAAGSTLIIDGEQGFVATKNSNILLEMNPTTSSQFKYDPSVSSNRHPNATIEYTSQGYRDGTKRVYQYFGMPFVSVDEFATSSDAYATQIDIWNRIAYENIGVLNYSLVDLSSSYAIDYSKFKQFGFYRMNANNPQGELQTYTISGQLVGNEDATMPLYQGWTTLSNAYTANMPVRAIEYANNERINNGSKVELSIYTYKQVGNSLIWTANNGLRRVTETLLPMQPFMLHNTGNYEEMTLSYNNLVWDPQLLESAPARVPQEMTKATVRIQNAEGLSDIVTFAQADNFSAEKDMFDAEQYMNEDINIYVTDEKRMDIFATDNIQNTYIGITAAQGGLYTMSFEDVAGQDLVLINLANNEVINIAEGQTYTINVMDNEQSDYRFKVVARQEMPTDIEDVVKTDNNSGIYTLTGVYVGEMNVWNNLPAGVYIVNGEKKIK